MGGDQENRGEDRSAAIQALTTEHAALQAARSATIFDATGRANLFLTAISGSLVALAFIGQVSQMGQSFFGFALLVLPTLVFIGVATFARVIQSAIEDVSYARGISRIRRFYVQEAPSIADYLVLPTSDDLETTMRGSAVTPSWWQPFLTTAGMVEVVNSVLSGAFVGTALAALAIGEIAVIVGSGLVVFSVSLALHHRVMLAAWDRVEQETPARFPG